MSITLTESAARHIQSTLANRGKGLGLRVGVKKVGCSGLAYTFDFADEIGANDLTFESHDTKVVVDKEFIGYLEFVPRHWLVFTAGQLVAFGGSQLMLAGAALLWVANQPLTWARAGLAAWLAWIELVLLWGVVPSEWLNLTQGPLGWTSQNIFLTIPPWLVLNNPIDISYAALKDMIAGGYHMFSLVVVLWFAFKIQDWGKTAPKQDDSVTESPYGRPMRKVT